MEVRVVSFLVFVLMIVSACEKSNYTYAENNTDTDTNENSSQLPIILFHNNGTFLGWDEVESHKVVPWNPEDTRNKECTTMGYDDNTSIICQGIYGKNDKYYNPSLDDGALLRHHSEVTKCNLAKEGDAVWVSFAIYIDGNANNAARIIAQWMDPNGWIPDFLLIASPVKGTDQLLINFNKNFYTNSVHYLTGCKMREWNIFTYLVKFSTQNDGYIDLYINGVKVPQLPDNQSGKHTYDGITMRQAASQRTLRVQCGGYLYWDSTAVKFQDYFLHYLDYVSIANEGKCNLSDLLPKKLPPKRLMIWV